MNIPKLLKKQVQSYPDKAAVIFEDKVITFWQLQETSLRFSNYLLKLGVNKGDKVALFLSNIPEAIFSFLGIFSLGAVGVPLDFMLTEEEVANFINHSQTKVLITQPKKGIDLNSLKSKCRSLENIIICREQIDKFLFWDKILGESKAEEISCSINDSDLSSIFYTSGSTGQPKGVMLTYKHFNNPPRTIDYFLKITADDVFLCGGVPFSHIGGLAYILLMLNFGSTLVLMQRFHPFEFLKNIQTHKVTIFCIVPAMFMAILSLKEYEGFDFSSLRYAVVFGAPSSPTLLKKFHAAYPKAQLANGWGMTETAAPNTISPPGDQNLGSIGKFTPEMEAKIVNEAGKTLGFNQNGELWVRGEAVMSGYFKEAGLTREVLTQDRWFKTGDIAYYDEQGLYYLVGRKKDMIKVAGEIVFSTEVEEKIYLHPKVKEVAVIGVSDKLRGEVPKAFVVSREDQALDEEELRDFLKEHLAHFKIPRYFEFVKELPKNRTGKVDKQLLRLSTRAPEPQTAS